MSNEHIIYATTIRQIASLEPPAVSLLTALAATTDLSDADYRAIYDRVATGRSLRNIELALRSSVSFAWWGRYAAGTAKLDRDRKNELLAWAGLVPLPPTPAEVVAEQAHPDAAVYLVGAAPASRVVLIGAAVPAVSLRINGNCALLDDACVQAVTGRIQQSRQRYLRPCLSLEPAKRIQQLESLLAAARCEAAAADPQLMSLQGA
jgi:hypothetical protein